MNLNRYCRLLLVLVAMLGIVQLAWTQTAVSPPDNTMASKAILAQQITGKPVPIVPAATIAGKPAARPTIWLNNPLTVKPALIKSSEPWFCHQPGQLSVAFCPKSLQAAYGVNQIVGANGGAGFHEDR